MNIPLFLEGQQISAFDKNNNIVEGAISLDENNRKVIKLEDKTVLFEDLAYVKFVGERLDEKLEDEIAADSQGIHWDKAAEDHQSAKDRDTLSDDFVNMEIEKHAGKNKAEITNIAKDLAQSKFMQADVDAGRVKPDGMIQDYIDEKNKKIESIEANMKQKIMEGDISRSDENYGEGNVYPIHDIPENELEGTQGISQDADASAMLDTNPIESNPVDAVDADIANATSSDKSELTPMSTDLEVTSGEPVSDYSADFADIDAALADDGTDTTDTVTDTAPTYDFTDIDAALADDGSDSSFEGLKTTLVDNNVDPEKAADVTKSIADDIASAVNHAVKDAIDTIENPSTSDVDTPVETETVPMDEDEKNSNPVSADAVDDMNTGNLESNASEPEDIDGQMEQVMDDYIADHGTEDESGMYETLCNVFNISNGTALLMEAKGCIPDAIIAMCEQLKRQ